LYAYVPRKVLLEQPLSSAFAVGAMASANAVMAVSVLAMVLRFMMISFLRVTARPGHLQRVRNYGGEGYTNRAKGIE
jgi:hypothetical protein